MIHHAITSWRFTKTEFEFMLTMQRHLDLRRAASALGWKYPSACTYAANVRRKMDVHSLLEAVVIFDRWTDANYETVEAIKARFDITI